MGAQLSKQLDRQNLRRIYDAQDLEELKDLSRVDQIRCRPSRLERLEQITKFNTYEIKLIYRGFKESCPSCIVSRNVFKENFLNLFPDMGPENPTGAYSDLVFNTFDTNGDGFINFDEFLLALSVISRGDHNDRLNWIYDLYDSKRQGFLNRDDFRRIVASMYEIINNVPCPEMVAQTPIAHADEIFNKMDKNHDGKLTRQEFVDTCRNDKMIMSSINVFETVL